MTNRTLVPATHSVRCTVLMATLAALTACGGVITPQPTEGISPARTPTPAATPGFRATATAPFLPPADTATPTVSPTPVVHIVQEGETLLAIALDYGVSLEALQTANGIEDPRFLQVGQQLIIPTGEETAGETSGLLLPTPTPLPFGVRGVAFYETPVGSLQCLGEIVNTTASTLTNVQVHLTLFDAAGQSVAEADTFAYADLIPPGERSPFGILFTTPPTAWASPQVTILRGEDAGALVASYVPVAVAGVTGQPSGPQFQVSGTVQNTDAEQAAGKVSVIATIYDAQGAVIGVRQGTVELAEPLAPGATAPFSLLLVTYGDVPPADFHVIAVGTIPTE